MIINITSDHGQIGPLRWINSNQIPQEFGERWFIVWGATFGVWGATIGVNGGTLRFQEVKQ